MYGLPLAICVAKGKVPLPLHGQIVAAVVLEDETSAGQSGDIDVDEVEARDTVDRDGRIRRDRSGAGAATVQVCPVGCVGL